MTQPTYPARPKRSAKFIVQKAAEALAPQVLQWLNQQGTLADIADDLARAMEYRSDGYEVARALESRGYSPDEELVEILSGAWSHLIKAHDAALREWTEAYRVPAPAIDAKVRAPKHPKAGDAVGIVIRNAPEGVATVCFPTLGHKTPGEQLRGNATLGFCIAWEELEPAG